MFRNPIESPLLNTIVGLTLLVGSGLNTLPASAAEFLYGGSGSSPNTLSLNGSTVLSTAAGPRDQFGLGIFNQGWWSNSQLNGEPNYNYFVGEDDLGFYNNFFTFDISEVLEPVTSATLNLQRNNGVSDSGRLTQSYYLFDVSTDAATLNNNIGASSAIFNDLGSGKQYGNFNVTVGDEDQSKILSFSLNSNAIADLNNAISRNEQFFSVGGTLEPVPEPSSILGLLAFAGLSLKAVAKRRKVESK